MNRMTRLCAMALAAFTLCTITSARLHAQCLPTWLYRVPITIDNTANSNTLNDYQVPITFDTQTPISQSKMRSDGADIRFALDPDGACQQVCYWVESGMNSGSTVIWLKLPTVGANSTTTVYMYYGNPGAIDASDAECVFDLFDDFNGGSLDGSKWQSFGNGTISVGGGSISFSTSTQRASSEVIRSTNGIPGPVITEANVLSASGNWPNISQQLGSSWNGYAMMYGSGIMNLGWTSESEPDYSGSWNDDTPEAGNVSGIWSMTWAATGQQMFSWPGGSWTLSDFNYDLSGNITAALGLLESGGGDMVVDWVRVRKYTTPEPSFSVGEEETVTPPSIDEQPESQAMCAGGSAKFSVVASGQFLTYQWRKNGIPIAGATESTYSIDNVQPSDAGNYDVVVRRQVTSNTATLTVYTPPGVVTNPVSRLICAGEPAAFSVQAAGSSLGYQWYRNETPIEGANSETLVLPVTSEADAGTYTVTVSGVCGEPVMSEPAMLALRPQPSIVSTTGSQTVCRGQIATFSVEATGDGLKYQWRRNGTPLEGATKSTLNVMAQPYSTGDYDVIVSGTCSPVLQTESAHLTVQLDPIITEQPLDQTLELGRTVTFKVKVIGGGVLSYQWFKDGTALPGRTRDTLIVQNVGLNDVADYSCAIKGTLCSDLELTVSNKAALILNIPPVIIKSPQDASVCEGSSITLSVTAGGLGLHYQWRKGGVAIPGANSRDLTIENATPADAASYDCVISSPAYPTPLTTTAATVTVNLPASIAAQPSDVVVCPGSPASFTVTANGGSLSYQWRKNGIDIPGATSATYTIPSAQTADSGVYSVLVDGACLDSALGSHTARLLFNDLTSITQQPIKVDGAPKFGTVTLSVQATGTSLTYQWYKDGATIPGATTPTYTITNAQPEQSGKYFCVVTGTCPPAMSSDTVQVSILSSGVPGEEVSAGAMLTVLPQPASGVTKLIVRVPDGVVARTGAELGLYNAKGELAMDLSDAFSRGSFRTAEFNASTLPSGTYYCRLVAGSWSGNLGSVVVVK